MPLFSLEKIYFFICGDGQHHSCGCLAPYVRMTNREVNSCISQGYGTLFVVNKVY